MPWREGGEAEAAGRRGYPRGLKLCAMAGACWVALAWPAGAAAVARGGQPAGLAATSAVPGWPGPDAGVDEADGFDPGQFGRLLSEPEQERWEGRFWWSVAFGVADAVWRYGSSRPFEPQSWRYWAGMAAAGAAGGTVGALSGSYQYAVRSVQGLGPWAQAGLRLYGYVRTKAMNEAFQLGLRRLQHRP